MSEQRIFATADKTNLACGSSVVQGEGWLNLDFSPMGYQVIGADLLGTLPIESDSMRLVYSSHFLEHIPRPRVAAFLKECWRVLHPEGTLRLVLPDFEEMAREYLRNRDAGEHEKGDFLVLEIIDQCVRRSTGGELVRAYSKYLSAPHDYETMFEYVRERTGEQFRSNILSRGDARSVSVQSRSLSAIVRRACERLRSRGRWWWFQLIVSSLPRAIREQNISMAAIGELHHWLWDFHQLRCQLEEIGFVGVRRMTASTSRYPGFPFSPLDLNDDGLPRKGRESMYVEAVKSGD